MAKKTETETTETVVDEGAPAAVAEATPEAADTPPAPEPEPAPDPTEEAITEEPVPVEEEVMITFVTGSNEPPLRAGFAGGGVLGLGEQRSHLDELLAKTRETFSAEIAEAETNIDRLLASILHHRDMRKQHRDEQGDELQKNPIPRGFLTYLTPTPDETAYTVAIGDIALDIGMLGGRLGFELLHGLAKDIAAKEPARLQLRLAILEAALWPPRKAAA